LGRVGLRAFGELQGAKSKLEASAAVCPQLSEIQAMKLLQQYVLAGEFVCQASIHIHLLFNLN
jgi:hypothetical protein